jgi:hypothetical protein
MGKQWRCCQCAQSRSLVKRELCKCCYERKGLGQLQGIRDPGRDRGRLWILESSDSGPGFRGSRTAGGVFHAGGTPGVYTGTKKNSGDISRVRDFDPWELFEHVEANAKKKKYRLCGEQWWDIGPSFILEHMGFDQDGRSRRSMANVRRSTTREKCAVFHANMMRMKDAKKAAKLQGGITQQSAEEAIFRKEA